MECKLNSFAFVATVKFELIDTLWNVNKEHMKDKRTQQWRINRYIMECKYRHEFVWI